MRLGYLFAFLLGMAAMVAIQGRTQTYLIGSGVAFHLDGESHCNNHVTPGFGIEAGKYAVGVYDNSNCKVSFYAARYWTPLYLQSLNLRLGTLGGLVTGYDAPVLPVGGFVAAWEIGERYKLNLIFIPPVGSSGNVAWIQWGVRW